MSETSTASHGLTGQQLVRRRTQRYIETLRWLITNLVLFRPLQVALLVGLVTVGRSLQAAAFAGLIWFFSSAQTNTALVVLGLSVDTRDGAWMALMLTVVAAAMVTATFVIYLSARMSFYLSTAFAEKIVESVLNLEGGYPTRTGLERNGSISKQVLDVTNGKQMMFRPINVLLTLPRHILLVIPAVFGMIWIAGEVVAFLALLVIPAAALNYIISHRVVAVQKSRKEVNRDFRKAMHETLDTIGDENRVIADRPALAQNLIESDSNRASIEVFSSYILSPRQSEFVSNVLAAVAVAAIGFYLGYEALSGVMPLAQVIGFFVMLRVTISGLTGTTIALTTYARFYGVLRSAYEYLTSPLKDPGRFFGKPVLHAAKQANHVPGALGKDVPVQRGVPVAIIAPAKLNRYTQYFFALALTQRSRQTTREKLNATALRCTAALAEPDRLAENGLLSFTEDTLEARLAGTAIAEIAPTIEIIRQAADDGDGLDGRDIARIALLTAYLSKAEYIIIGFRVLAALPDAEIRLWLAALTDRFIAIAYRPRGFDGCIGGEAHAVLLDKERAVAVVESQNAADAARAVTAILKSDGNETESLDDEMDEE